MPRWLVLPGVSLAAYSVWLVAVEASGGAQALRPYVSDVDGPVPLFALNTSLSVWLLLSGGVIWLTCHHLPQEARRARTFGPLQAVIMVGLALDDRFLVHERLGTVLAVDDALLLGAAGVVQLGLLVAYRDVALPDRSSTLLLIAGGMATAGMLLVDGVGSADAPFRLAAEEVTKVWGTALLALWSWAAVRAHAVSTRAGVLGTPR